MRKRAATLICAGTFGLFHIIVVVLPVIASGGGGESQGMRVAIFDMPLVVVLDHVPGGGRIVYYDVGAYLVFFSLVGTLMYASCGALIGYVIDRIRKSVA
jgi:hypothetical protein